MATIKLQNGKVVTKGGIISCTCCDGGGGGDICDLNLNSSGGDEGYNESFQVDTKGGKLNVLVNFEAYSVKDRLIISITGGTVLYDTGCISNSVSKVISIPENTNSITVTVVPNCAGTTGTEWVLSISCLNVACPNKISAVNFIEGPQRNPSGPCVDFLDVEIGPVEKTGLYRCSGFVDDQATITWNGGSFFSPATTSPCFGAHEFSFITNLNQGDMVKCNAGSWGARYGCDITCCNILAP